MNLARWAEHAAYQGKNLELFFSVSTTRSKQRQADEKEAKKICASCVVRLECLTFALETGQDYGIWGGMNEEERRVLTRRMGGIPTAAASQTDSPGSQPAGVESAKYFRA